MDAAVPQNFAVSAFPLRNHDATTRRPSCITSHNHQVLGFYARMRLRSALLVVSRRPYFIATVTACAAAVAAMAAVSTARATFKTVKEMKAQREQALSPFLDLVVPKATQYKYSREENNPLLGMEISDMKSYSYYLDDIRCTEIVNLSSGVARQITIEWEIIKPTLKDLLENCIELNELNAKYNEDNFQLSMSFDTYIESSGQRREISNKQWYPMSERGSGWVISEASLSPVDYCVPFGRSKYRYFVELPEAIVYYLPLCVLYACEKQDVDQIGPAASMRAINISVIRIKLKYSGLDGREYEARFELHVDGICDSVLPSDSRRRYCHALFSRRLKRV